MSDLEMSNNNNENRNSRSPDLHIYVKGSPFHIHKEYLAMRSAKVSLLLERNEIDELRWILQDIEANPKTFELVVRFCYGYEVEFSSENVVSVLCIAYYLEMNEQQSSNNLLGKASTYLETRVLPCWNETVIALRSGGKSLDKLAGFGLVELLFDSLIEKASYDPRLLGEVVAAEEDEYRPNPRRRLFVKDWKSEDLITVPLPLYESLITRAVKSRSIPAEYIVSSVCKFAKKWVFDAEGSVSSQAIEAVERLLPYQRGLISCEFLFELLKHSISLQASSETQNGFEVRISKQLDTANPKDLKILTRGHREEKSESFVEANLVKTVVTRFYANHAAATKEQENSEESVSRFAKVAKLLEEFLILAASEPSTKLETFVALAEIAAAISQGVLRYSDGIYKAVDVFLERHVYLTETEKLEACRVLDCDKLSQEVCEEASKNQRLPIRIVIRVLFVSQNHIRDDLAKEIKGVEENVEQGEEEEEIVVSSDEDEMEKMSKKLLRLEIENRECVVHRCKKKKKTTKTKKMSVWRQVKRKFGCLSSPSVSVDSCTCDFKKKKKTDHH
ncbi:unnamed protein product [Cochlearia groenlandica]